MSTSRVGGKLSTMATRDDQEFVRGIFDGHVAPTGRESALDVMERLARIGFDGGFAGHGAYFRWECGSWLGDRVTEVIRLCEEASGRNFMEVVSEQGVNHGSEAWLRLVDSYLILPIPSYKTESLNPLPSTASEQWQAAMAEAHQTWRVKAFTPPKGR